MKTALIVHGGWGNHDPEECAALYRRWLHEDGFSVRMATETSAFADPTIHDLSLIVPVFTRGAIARNELDNLRRAVSGGVGLAGHHGGMGDAFDEPDYRELVGGRVTEGQPAAEFMVEMAVADEALTAGIKPFSFRGERPVVEVAEGSEVLATGGAEGDESFAVAWRRQQGAGRVFLMTLGHSTREIETGGVATLLRRGVNWAAREG
jgi:type 1 glutamine amidotransferase